MKPNENLYLSVNETWIKNAKIPEGRPALNTFLELDLKTEKILTNDIENILYNSKESYSKEFKEFLKLYKMALNKEEREKNGINGIEKILTYLENINDFKKLNDEYYHLILNSIDTPISFWVYSDMKNSTKHALYLDIAPTFLPDKSYYLDAEKYIKNINKFKKYTLVLLKSFFNEEKALFHLENSIKYDKLFAEYIKSSVERANYVQLYNERSIFEIKEYSKFLNFEKIIRNITKEECKTVITEPIFFENLNKFLNDDNFENIKSWIIVNFIIKNSDLFTEDLRLKGMKFSNFLNGIEKPLEFKKYYYKKIKSYFSEVVGIYYANKYFGNKAKDDVLDMCKKIIKMFQKRINNNTWLHKETKEKAISKLNKIEILIGFPDKIKNIYEKYIIKENSSLFKNILNIRRISNLNSIKKLHKDVDKKEWSMSADTVNAYYSPTNNLICFPAAILQEPFYSINQSKSENYGGIGAVIAHEISHAFDNMGSKYDEDGNINNWWKEEDFKNFEKLTNLMIEQWDGLETEVGVVNGKLTVSENIADNGGIACSLAVLEEENYCNYKEFFTNWARIWRMIAKDEFSKLLLENDVHAPNILRANMQVKNFDKFYEAFNIKKGDKMFLEEDKRIIIW